MRSSGIPIISPITRLGMWRAYCASRSPRPASTSGASSSRATARTRGSIARTRLGVKARETSARSRSWRGGSRLWIVGTRPGGLISVRSDENVAVSVAIAYTSAKRDTAQKPAGLCASGWRSRSSR